MYKAKLNRTKLKNIKTDERSLFSSLAHLSNEINAFQKAYLWASTDIQSENLVIIHGQVSLSLIFLKILAGKLYEGNNLLHKKYYGTRISQTYENSLPFEGQETLSKIRKYFSQTNIICIIRNKFSFHYSPNEVDRENSDSSEEMTVYLEHGWNANNLYYFAEVLANKALLNSIGEKDEQTAYHQITQDVIKVSGWFGIAIDNLMAVFLRRHFPEIWEGKVENVEIANLPFFSEIRIPWFSDGSTLK